MTVFDQKESEFTCKVCKGNPIFRFKGSKPIMHCPYCGADKSGCVSGGGGSAGGGNQMLTVIKLKAVEECNHAIGQCSEGVKWRGELPKDVAFFQSQEAKDPE